MYGGPSFPLQGPTYASAIVGAAADGTSLWANVTLTLPNGSALTYVPPHVSAYQNSSRCPTEIGVSASYCGWFSIRGSNGQYFNASLATPLEPGSTVISLIAAVEPPVPGILVRSLGGRTVLSTVPTLCPTHTRPPPFNSPTFVFYTVPSNFYVGTWNSLGLECMACS